ncbi:MAG: LemA family protein [Flavobacteriales bacterium]|nr:LemA family protein [Flavobacteriales bacterium]
MKKYLTPLVIIGVLVLLGLYYISVKNGAVTVSQAVSKEWGNVETSYQRRNDLIGNLVQTVKGAADFEKSTLTAVIEARAAATKVTIDPTNITSDQIAEFSKVQSGLTGALSKLLVSVERYPELKANQNFLELQAQLEGTENRISVARTRFNESVEAYNNYILKMPRNLFLGSYTEKAYFKADEGAEKAPEVNFDFK